MSKSSSVLFGLESVTVDRVERGPDGKRMVHLLTAEPWVGLCPECGVRSSVPNGWATTRPRDVRFGPDRPLLVWRKRKWLCSNGLCQRRVFTESTPDFPARCRVSARSKQQMAAAVLDEDRSVKSAATSFGCDWKVCHRAVVAVADAVLAGEPDPVTVLGIDETRRGKAKWETCPDTGSRTWVDRWDTGLVDITGTQGLLGQVNGRTSKAVTDWLAERDQSFRDGIKFVTIDMSAVYAKAVREALPNASLVVDRFHLVKRANQMVDAVRQRVTRTMRGRRGRKLDPEWLNRRRLLRAKESLTHDQVQKMLDRIVGEDIGDDLAAAWIAKELLRDLLACKDNGGLSYEIHLLLDRFYQFAASCAVPEILDLAQTVSTWQGPIITALQTNLSNARSEGYNRIVKHVGRIAFGFRNPANQRRRVRWACTRQKRLAPSGSNQQFHC